MLKISNLRVDYYQNGRSLPAVKGVSLEVKMGSAVALVGESGSGKSTVAQSIMRLIRFPIGDITGGSISLDGTELLDLTSSQMRKTLRDEIGYVPQDPTTALDPLCTVGRHVTETLHGVDRKQRRATAVDVLDHLGVPRPADRLRSYPHQFSGGMKQRVAIAAALAKEPKLVIADEPTTALDVTTQLGIIRLLARQREERSLALLFVTHDLSVAQALCDEVVVMYAGAVVESGPLEDVIGAPRHPYTRALVDCIPQRSHPLSLLPAIPGQPPTIGEVVSGCSFAPRCSLADDRCRADAPPVVRMGDVDTACWMAGR